MRYEEGQKVRVRGKQDLLDMGCDLDSWGLHNSGETHYMTESMIAHCGEVVTIKLSGNAYRIAEDRQFTWQTWMFEDTEENMTDKVIDILRGTQCVQVEEQL